MSLRMLSAYGLLPLAIACSWADARETDVSAAPPSKSAETEVADSQSLKDFDGNALYGNIELAKAAIERASKELENDPNSVKWLVARGIAHSATGDFFSALMDFEDAMAADPTSPEPHRALGYTYRVYRRPDKALPHYNKAIELGSKSIDCYMGRAAIYSEQNNFEAACADYDEVIRVHPDHTMAWLGRAMLPGRDWKEAKADYDKTIELSGHAPYAYAYRAGAHVHRGEYDEFCADILTAMKNNPGDVGVEYDPLAEEELTGEDLKFGEEQLRNMLRDRPEMAEWVEEGDELWNWTLRRFAGSAGVRVSWDPSHAGPTGGESGEHDDGSGSWIRVEAYEHTPAEFVIDQLWCTAVFELHNCAHMDGWNQLSEQLRNGALDRATYQLKSHEWEDLTLQRTRAFYVKFLVPFLAEKAKAEASTPSNWYCQPWRLTTDKQQRLAAWKQGPLWAAYGEHFDLTQAYRLFYEQDCTGCIALLDAILHDPTNNSPQQLFSARALRAGALATNGDIAAGIEVLQQNLWVSRWFTQ